MDDELLKPKDPLGAQSKLIGACWVALGLAFFIHVLRSYSDRIAKGDLGTLGALAFGALLVFGGFECWQQRRWAAVLMIGCVTIVVFVSLDLLIFFAVKAGSRLGEAVLCVLLFFSLYTIGLLTVILNSQSNP